MSVTNETKKRSTLKRGSILDLPPTLDRKKFKYRWVSKTRLDLASDGYEPRGYNIFTTEEGKHVSRGDLILCRKTTEEADSDKEAIQAAASRRMESTLQDQKAQDDRLSYEVKKAGGKIKFSYGEE